MALASSGRRKVMVLWVELFSANNYAQCLTFGKAIHWGLPAAWRLSNFLATCFRPKLQFPASTVVEFIKSRRLPAHSL
jgi:hypothetical protein